MKAVLLSVWQQNETRIARYPLIFGALFLIVASALGLLQDNKAGAISGVLWGRR